MDTTIQDDALMLHRPAPAVRFYAKQMHDLGADHVRLTAGWSALAPDPLARKRPRAPFDPDNSRTYPAEPWARLDSAIKAVVANHMQPHVDLAFWAPRWATPKASPQKARQRYMPSADEFGHFVRAVANRYSGRFPDPAAKKGTKLPAVRLFTIWNEPNEPSFLMPQWKGTRPYSPHLYRAMYVQGYHALKQVSPANEVLIGGTSAKGSQTPGEGGVAPLEFLRTMACVDEYLRPLAVPECRDYQPLTADGYAHHPYSLDTSPGTSDPDLDDAPIADVQRLSDTIAKLKQTGRITGAWPLYLTEYGYESSDADPVNARFGPKQQAAYLGWASFLAWRRADVALFGQFLLRDIDPKESGFTGKRRYRDWQTGLLRADGSPKPAAQAFKLPFFAQLAQGQSGPVLFLWGGVRPGQGHDTVRVMRQDPTSGQWFPVRTAGTNCDESDEAFLTGPDRWFTRTADWQGPGHYRLDWLHGNPARWEQGAEITVTDEPLAMPPQ